MGSGMLEIEPQTPSTKHQSITYTEAYPPWGDKVSVNPYMPTQTSEED